MLEEKPQPLVRTYRGGSMFPLFRHGDLLVLSRVDAGRVEVGDVLVFRSAGAESELLDGTEGAREIVHRVIEKLSSGFRTQGDSNPRPDGDVVEPSAIVGRVTAVGRSGGWCDVRSGRAGLRQVVLLRSAHGFRRWAATRFGGPYRLLRRSGLARRVWRPKLRIVHVTGGESPVVKYIAGGRTVAWWWPERRRFTCRKPFDLVIPDPRSASLTPPGPHP